MSSYNAYRYTKGQDPVLDTEFACATAYEKLLNRLLKNTSLV